ncbi:MAG: low molecular weight phosphatase family protein [Candidatus Acidiferrum sp.]
MKKIARKRVLFVCLGNACRSPMAEAIAGRLGHDIIEASSAGFTPLGHVETMTLQTLARNGYPAEGLKSKPVLREELLAADVIVNMSGRPKRLAFHDHSKVEDWNVEDPYGATPEIYQRIFQDIEKRVAELADRLRDSARAKRTAEKAKSKGMGRA